VAGHFGGSLTDDVGPGAWSHSPSRQSPLRSTKGGYSHLHLTHTTQEPYKRIEETF
jgi:hypothetical protein